MADKLKLADIPNPAVRYRDKRIEESKALETMYKILEELIPTTDKWLIFYEDQVIKLIFKPLIMGESEIKVIRTIFYKLSKLIYLERKFSLSAIILDAKDKDELESWYLFLKFLNEHPDFSKSMLLIGGSLKNTPFHERFWKNRIQD